MARNKIHCYEIGMQAINCVQCNRDWWIVGEETVPWTERTSACCFFLSTFEIGRTIELQWNTTWHSRQKITHGQLVHNAISCRYQSQSPSPLTQYPSLSRNSEDSRDLWYLLASPDLLSYHVTFLNSSSRCSEALLVLKKRKWIGGEVACMVRKQGLVFTGCFWSTKGLFLLPRSSRCRVCQVCLWDIRANNLDSTIRQEISSGVSDEIITFTFRKSRGRLFLPGSRTPST